MKIILASATLSLPSQLNDKSLKLTEFDKRSSVQMTLKFTHKNWTEQEKKYLNILTNLGFRNQLIDICNSNQTIVTNQAVYEIWHYCESETEKQHIMAYLIINFKVPTLVFCATIAECKTFAQCFQLIGLPARALHSKQEQRTRLKSIDRLKQDDECAIIFTTDVAARGIDIPAVKLVIQYSAPNSPATHIHRIGRCARQESKKGQKVGVAVSLIAPDDCEKYKVVKKACEVEPGSIEQFKFEVLDRI